MTQMSTLPETRKMKWPTFAWMIFIHLGALLAPFTFSWSALLVFLSLYWITNSLGICLGYHRLLTHRSFKVVKPLEYLFTLFGCLALQGGPISWVASHRIHHAYSDKHGDPHSPKENFLWGHMLWCVTYIEEIDDYHRYVKYVPDLSRDRVHLFLDKTHAWWSLLLAAALFAWGGLPFLVWGFFLRTAFGYHCTWFVNSAAHRWGYRNFQVKDDSKNNWWVAFLSFGEGWHNNHHAFQQSARHGLRWWELDCTYLVIRGLALCRLASDIRTPQWRQALLKRDVAHSY